MYTGRALDVCKEAPSGIRCDDHASDFCGPWVSVLLSALALRQVMANIVSPERAMLSSGLLTACLCRESWGDPTSPRILLGHNRGGSLQVATSSLSNARDTQVVVGVMKLAEQAAHRERAGHNDALQKDAMAAARPIDQNSKVLGEIGSVLQAISSDNKRTEKRVIR